MPGLDSPFGREAWIWSPAFIFSEDEIDAVNRLRSTDHRRNCAVPAV